MSPTVSQENTHVRSYKQSNYLSMSLLFEISSDGLQCAADTIIMQDGC